MTNCRPFSTVWKETGLLGVFHFETSVIQGICSVFSPKSTLFFYTGSPPAAGSAFFKANSFLAPRLSYPFYINRSYHAQASPNAEATTYHPAAADRITQSLSFKYAPARTADPG